VLVGHKSSLRTCDGEAAEVIVVEDVGQAR
jgi:hypothetical protein